MQPGTATKEYFEQHLVCRHCGRGLTVRGENICYGEGTDGAAPDEFYFFAQCAMCLIITRIPAYQIPEHIQQIARDAYIDGIAPTVVRTYDVGEEHWMTLWQLFRAMLVGKVRVNVKFPPRELHAR